ncbi:hypothetical protein HMPREF6123_1840 [Oribacterium sinus F0268]|uniref:Uncharacterized protein n=1 Tax=Oribacterium sinus F0268 TaxID=585501 RepID=C2KZC1_9FIRM|nr:hypothetical protein HMPREF6123_1840 [Oribacterium sinus F0268]
MGILQRFSPLFSPSVLGLAPDFFLFLFDGMFRYRTSRHYEKQE